MRLATESPFNLEPTVRVLQRRPSNLIDRWDHARYRRTLRLGDRPVLIEVVNRGTLDAPDLKMSIRRTDGDGRPLSMSERAEAARLVSAILGLAVDSSLPQRRAEAEPALRATALALRGMRPPRYPDLFETFANVIPFQQLSLEAGMAVVAQLIRRFGQSLSIQGESAHLFPSADIIADAAMAQLKRCGMSRHKCLALRAAARAIASGALTAKTLEGLPSPVALARLMELPGIGPWSAALILLRGLRRVDVFPQADTGAESSLIALMHLRSRASLERVVERFGEHRGYLYFYGLASRLLASGLIRAAASPDPSAGDRAMAGRSSGDAMVGAIGEERWQASPAPPPRRPRSTRAAPRSATESSSRSGGSPR